MAACLPTWRRGLPTASGATWMATCGRPRDGREKATTACTFSLPTARSSARFIFQKRARIFVSAEARRTAYSWRQANLFMRSTLAHKVRKYLELPSAAGILAFASCGPAKKHPQLLGEQRMAPGAICSGWTKRKEALGLQGGEQGTGKDRLRRSRQPERQDDLRKTWPYRRPIPDEYST